MRGVLPRTRLLHAIIRFVEEQVGLRLILRKFAEGGGLEMVDGIGPKSAERIKASLSRR